MGQQLDTQTPTPEGGDPRTMVVAEMQHRLPAVISQIGTRSTATDVTTRFGFAKPYWLPCLGAMPAQAVSASP